MNEKKCKDCQYFFQHYGINKRSIYRVHCGHCTFNRAKRKDPDARVCENFVQGIDDAEAFATKEYLSKELLKYILSLELLPELERERERVKE